MRGGCEDFDYEEILAHAAELETLSQAHAAELAATRDEASKGSETAQAALRNVRVMLTPVKGDASAARVPETPPPGYSTLSSLSFYYCS